MSYHNIAKAKAIESKYKQQFLELCPELDENSGIYFLLRVGEDGLKYGYVGQAKHILSRLAQHMTGYQHIDLSLKSHKLYDKDSNPYGWRVGFIHCPISELDEQEQKYIKAYANAGFQMRNKTAGSQSKGKTQIDEFRPAKGYYDGLKQGRKNASKEIAHLFDLHLEVKCKSEKANKNQQKALEKFNEFLEYYKSENET